MDISRPVQAPDPVDCSRYRTSTTYQTLAIGPSRRLSWPKTNSTTKGRVKSLGSQEKLAVKDADRAKFFVTPTLSVYTTILPQCLEASPWDARQWSQSFRALHQFWTIVAESGCKLEKL